MAIGKDLRNWWSTTICLSLSLALCSFFLSFFLPASLPPSLSFSFSLPLRLLVLRTCAFWHSLSVFNLLASICFLSWFARKNRWTSSKHRPIRKDIQQHLGGDGFDATGKRRFTALSTSAQFPRGIHNLTLPFFSKNKIFFKKYLSNVHVATVYQIQNPSSGSLKIYINVSNILGTCTVRMIQA